MNNRAFRHAILIGHIKLIILIKFSGIGYAYTTIFL